MINRHFLSTMLAVALLAGCATGTAPPPTVDPTTGVVTYTTNAAAERAVFTAKSGYSVVLATAVAYKNLRPCAVPAAQPCSDPAVVAQLQRADNVASMALDAAEAAVRTPSVGSTARDRAIATANSALAALSALISNLGVSK